MRVFVLFPEEHTEYWQAVYGLVLKGRLGEARDLLLHHTLSHTMPDVSNRNSVDSPLQHFDHICGGHL